MTGFTCDSCGAEIDFQKEGGWSRFSDLALDDSDAAEIAEDYGWYVSNLPETYEDYCKSDFDKCFLKVRMYCPNCAERAKRTDTQNQQDFADRMNEDVETLPVLEDEKGS